MASKLIMTCLLLSAVFFAECYDCEYCKGTSCNKEKIPLISCEEQPTDLLPYNFTVTFNGSIEACLDLEYVEEKEIYPVKQCFLLSESYNLCDEVRSVLPSNVKLDKCEIVLNEKIINHIDQLSDTINLVTNLPLLPDVSTKKPVNPSTNLLSSKHISPVTTPLVKQSTQPANHPTTQPISLHTNPPTNPTTVPSTNPSTNPITVPSLNPKPNNTTNAPTTQITSRSINQSTILPTNQPTNTSISAPTTKNPGGHSNIAIISLFVFNTSLMVSLFL